MNRFLPALGMAVIPLLCACTAPHEPRRCALGSMAHIEAPQFMAMETAAQATVKYGYKSFSVVRDEGSGDDYKMLIKMSANEFEPDQTTFIATDILAQLR